MNENRRYIVWIAGINLLLLIAAVWSRDQYSETRRQLSVTSSDTQLCRKIVDELAQVRGTSPDGTPQPSATDRNGLPQRLYQIVQACGMSPDSVIHSLRADSPHSITGSAETVNTIEISLHGLTLEQLARFLYQLQIDEPQLVLTGLTLAEPSGFGGGALWNVEPLRLAFPVDPSQEAMNQTVGVR